MLRSNSRRPRLTAAGAALCAGLAFAVPAIAANFAMASATPSAGASTFVVGDTSAVDTLNPFLGFTPEDHEVYGLIYDNLMDYGQLNYAGTPRLATSWSHSKNGLEIGR